MSVSTRFKRSVNRGVGRIGGTVNYESKDINAAISPVEEDRQLDDEFDLSPRTIDIVAEQSSYTDGIPALAAVVTVTHAGHGITAVKYSIQGRAYSQGVVTLRAERRNK